MAAHHHEDTTSSIPSPIIMVMVPFTAQSHLNQALQLSFLISSYQIEVHYAASSKHNRQVKHRLTGGEDKSSDLLSKIHFHDLPIPHFLSPLPNPNSTTKFPAHLQPSFDATMHLRHPVGTLLRQLSTTTRRLIVIHDTLMFSVVQDVADIPNAESYSFRCVSAFSTCCMKSLYKGESIPPVEECSLTNEIKRLAADQAEFVKIKQGDILNTCRQMESSYLDLLDKNESNLNNKQWAIAPLINRVRNINSTGGGNECLLWLEKQPPKSVMYVSFGSSTSMTDEQIEAMAFGLKESKQRFLWVLRDADKGDIFTGEVRNLKLPNGFEESVKETGMVVRDWVPQMEILAHRSVGGFMSHCGWNSCLESLSLGVPIAAWPIHSDQPYNALFISEILKVGIEVREWADQSEVVSSFAIKRAVERLMDSEEGERIRKRAEEVGGLLRDAAEEGGVSQMEMDSFIAHITR
ncbi:zeatin O-glucosyltransferase-like [Impatiens glandulifera]|uniref:zeatin O-glucosyltransferase-like n=1 Tax=Impatiens glandulifera TaxID=253017 RepID=UPI001FB0D3B1|nr:zeatin O-glucosyltransferase-like [Impatiens glandulifera]